MIDDGVLKNEARSPACGRYADGYERVAHAFTWQLRSKQEIGAALTVYHRGRCVVDLWGGLADVEAQMPWQRDTRAVVFSVTKGLTAMALAALADRGKLAWDEPVASCWPGFAARGKGKITFRQLFNHRAGLAALDTSLSMDDCVLPARRERLLKALEAQRPLWAPGEAQGYHAVTFGMYAAEVFSRLAGESVGTFLRRELFEPLGADVSLGANDEELARAAQIYPPSTADRLSRMLAAAVMGGSIEARVARATLAPVSIPRRAFLNPTVGAKGMLAYNEPAVRRAELAWASATASAHGLARAYLPFASDGAFESRRFLRAGALDSVYERQSWSGRDLVLQKPIGWSEGFLKDESSIFSPTRESFGHAGMGGALGWCDPVKELTLGYVMNRLDWRVRSPRALTLCHALYGSEAVLSA